MELLLSSQSVGLAAVVAAGCMVAAGASSNRWLSWWSQRRDRRRETIEPTEELPVSARHHVAIAGRLRQEGTACARLEDAGCAAASTFYLRHGAGTHAFSVRANCLYLDVKGARIRLEGPLLVDVGSEEQFPGGSLLELRGRVMDRVGEARQFELAARRDVPRWGVFRSLVDGDDVVVTGWLDRDEGGPASYRSRGGGATLRPADDEALIASCRRRPTVRGALGAIAVWAAAFLVGP